jgi:MinD superfamily P-loop ATPase
MRCLDDELVLVDLDANEPDTEVLLMMEIAEELRYDERNHGLLHAEDLNAEILKVDLDGLYTLAF